MILWFVGWFMCGIESYKYNASCQKKKLLTTETTDTKIQKRPRTKTCRTKNENSSSTLLEELASEAVSSSQIELGVSSSQDDDDRKDKNEVDDDEEKKKKNMKLMMKKEEKKKNKSEDDGINTVNAHTFPMHFQPNATGDIIVRTTIGKSLDYFGTIFRENDLEDIFRNSCFGQYLDLPMNNNAHFQLTIVYELLKRSFKNPKLVALLNDKDTSKKHKESLFLLWFVHNVLMSKDVNNNIPLNYVKLSEDIEAFNNFSWGHDNYELTIIYLLAPLSPETNNLFCFSWDFMTWAFEGIPHLRHQVTTKEKISSLRILRWLPTKNVKNARDLFNPRDDAVSCYITNFKLSYASNVVIDEAYVAIDESFVIADALYVATYYPSIATCDPLVTTCYPNVAIDDSYAATYDPSVATCDTNVVHPWLVAIEKELQMSSLITLGLVETLFDPRMDRVKTKLTGATTIKRARDMVDATVRAGVNIGVGVDVGGQICVGADIGFGGQSVGATSCSRCSRFLCEKCKKHNDDSIMYLQTLSETVNEFKYKKGVRLTPSNKVGDPNTPQVKWRKTNPLSRQ
ncbi:hypothetical protein H5410_046251 [Solanum commersonii]|uniref:DUF1985 domain-containing protein n=1 Tax=Solanum commersonii TaxID=4109 RepID=A0A9J5XBS2_SOLCO|nr:hypothetical protein H5410_046251 [Solanum commersonii]